MADDPKQNTGGIIAHIEARADTGERRTMSDGGYDTDFAQWTTRQAKALRDAAHAASNLPIDWEHVAEEIEALGKSQERELARRISRILVHLIKLQASATAFPRNGWRRTIRTQRKELSRLLKGQFTLRATVPAVIEDEIDDARQEALEELADYGETPRVDVAGIAYTEDQILGPWFPG
jgi:hypothetical protein